jgi:hypothetical protein
MIEDLKRLTREREREIQQYNDKRERERRETARIRSEQEQERDRHGKRVKRSRQESPPSDGRVGRVSGNTPPVQPGAYPPPGAGQDMYRQPHQVSQHPGFPAGAVPSGFQAEQYQYPNQPGYGNPYSQQVPVPGQYMPQQAQMPMQQHPQYAAYPNPTNGVNVPQGIYPNQQVHPQGYGAPAAPTYNAHGQKYV